MEPTDNQPRTARRPWLARWSSAATMIVFTAIAAAISYGDGLYLIRFAGALGLVVYLYPLLPDGLILISSIRLYRAAPERPAWAMAGVIIGVALTLAMNIGAGVLHSWMYALADGCVPVVFFVALEILRGQIKRDPGGSDTSPARVVPGQPAPGAQAVPDPVPPAGPEPEAAAPDAGTPEPLTKEAALLALIGTAPQREIAAMLGVSKTTVGRWKARLSQDGDAGQPDPEDTPAIRYSMPDELPEPALNGSAAGG